MDGCYVGRVAVDDPLHPMLCRVLDEGMGVAKVRSFAAFRLKLVGVGNQVVVHCINLESAWAVKSTMGTMRA